MNTEVTKTRNLFGSGKLALQECRNLFKQGGVRAVIKRFGWKIFAVFFVYYLVRDLTLYIFIPYIIAQHFLG